MANKTIPSEAEIKASLPEMVTPGTTELFVVIGLLCFLCVMGSVGNALVLYVFSKKKDKMVSTLFIVIMAVVDFSTCIFIMPCTIYMEYVDFKIEYDILCKIYQFLITSNIPFSALIMVAIAIDRYLCICHPFLHLLNLARAKVMSAALAIFAATLGIIVSLMYGVYQVKAPVVTQVALGNGLNNSNVTVTYDSIVATEANQVLEISTQSMLNTSAIPSVAPEREIIYTGSCAPNELIVSKDFMWYYQKFYVALYLVCLFIVIVLYTLIYKSVLTRRAKRAKQKSKALPIVVKTTGGGDGGTSTCEETLLTTVERDLEETIANGNEVKNGKHSSNKKDKKDGKKSKEERKKEKERKKSKKGDKSRMANLKTAAMLFVVTVVFIVTFMPAFLMMLSMVPYNMIVFYMYFANNVANPVIYSFMNRNFREDLKKIFCRP